MRTFVLGLTFTALFAAAAQAAPSRRELDERMIALEQRLATVEGRVLTGDPAAVALQRRVSDLELTLQSVTGALEQAQRENRDLKQELDTLRRQVELRTSGRFANGASAFGAPVGGDMAGGEAIVESDPAFYGDSEFAEEMASVQTPLGAEVEGPAVVLPDDPDAAFNQARNFMLNGDFQVADQAFEQFNRRFPNAPQRGEALYWHGETKYINEDYDQARALYIESLRASPSGSRAPDALVKLSLSLFYMGQGAEACATLAAFPQEFPRASAAARARAARARAEAGC